MSPWTSHGRHSEATGCSMSSITRVDGKAISFSVRIDRLVSRRFERRRPMTLLGVEVSMASAEDTSVAKLEWLKASGGSERQRRDVAGMLATVGDDLDYPYIDDKGSYPSCLRIRER